MSFSKMEGHSGCIAVHSRRQTQRVQTFLLLLKSTAWVFSPTVYELLECTAIYFGLSSWLVVETLLMRAEPGGSQEQQRVRDRFALIQGDSVCEFGKGPTEI